MSSATPTHRTIKTAGPIQIGLLADFAVHEIDLPLPSVTPDLVGKRILHLSDTHFRAAWCAGYDRVIAKVAELDVDLVCFTGDWLEDKFDFRDGVATAQRFARALKSRFGTYACLGNHDGDLLTPYLVDADVQILVGESRRIVGGEGTLEIIGLPGVDRDDLSADLVASFGRPPSGTTRIVLSHFPDHVKKVASIEPHLVLAGHTHGGQWCLPSGRPLFTHDDLPKTNSAGLTEFGKTYLHVSRGLGCSKWNLRLWCAPEMTVIRLLAS
jgi:predicted MPP superfamily phosphohydrolase